MPEEPVVFGEPDFLPEMGAGMKRTAAAHLSLGTPFWSPADDRSSGSRPLLHHSFICSFIHSVVTRW